MSAGTRKREKAAERQDGDDAALAFQCVSQVELAGVLGIVTRQVHNLEKKGLPREPRGYPLGACVRWYVQYKMGAQQTQIQPRKSRSEAEERKANAEAGLLEAKLRRELGEVVELKAYEAEMRRILGNMRREINNLVGILSPEILHLTELAEARRVVQKARDSLLERMQQIADQDPEADE